MAIALRPARHQDFGFCRDLYFAEMEWIIEELHLDQNAQARGFEQQWDVAQVGIITVDGADVGWLQTFTQDGDFFVAQLFVGRAFQGQGIGTKVMEGLLREAALVKQVVRVNVVKINPAVRMYKRLGFLITHEDERKFYMKRDPV